jgi:hypothetical protein
MPKSITAKERCYKAVRTHGRTCITVEALVTMRAFDTMKGDSNKHKRVAETISIE